MQREEHKHILNTEAVLPRAPWMSSLYFSPSNELHFHLKERVKTLKESSSTLIVNA